MVSIAIEVHYSSLRCLLKFLVVCSARGRVDQAASDTGDKQVVIDDEFNDRVQRLLSLFKHVVQLFSLRNSAGETVKNESVNQKINKTSKIRDPCITLEINSSDKD